MPVFVEEPRMELLFESENHEADFESQRDRLILEFLYATGMRLSELIGLSDQDVDAYQGS